MKSSKQIRMALIEKASEDEDFRARLRTDAKSAIENEFDIALPDGFSMQVREERRATLR